VSNDRKTSEKVGPDVHVGAFDLHIMRLFIVGIIRRRPLAWRYRTDHQR
jgi:hypothetical protein